MRLKLEQKFMFGTNNGVLLWPLLMSLVTVTRRYSLNMEDSGLAVYRC